MTPNRTEQVIGETLERWASKVKPAGPGRWSFDLVNGRRLPGLATWREDWLELRVPFPNRLTPELPWALLRENSALRGVARFVRHDERRIGLVGDVAIGGHELTASRIEAAGTSLLSAEAVGSGKASKSPGKAPPPFPPDPAADGDPGWERIGEEGGWRVNKRDDGRYAVELDAPGLMNQAFLERRGGRGEEPVISLDLLRAAGLSPVSRRAIALFLLGLTGRLRSVRGAVTREEPEVVRLEVALPVAPAATAPELDLALEALSLACRLGSREVKALGQEPLARIYLAHTMED